MATQRKLSRMCQVQTDAGGWAGGSTSPDLSFFIYKVGKIIPSVATSQVIIDRKAGLMLVKIETNVSSLLR